MNETSLELFFFPIHPNSRFFVVHVQVIFVAWIYRVRNLYKYKGSLHIYFLLPMYTSNIINLLTLQNLDYK